MPTTVDPPDHTCRLDRMLESLESDGARRPDSLVLETQVLEQVDRVTHQFLEQFETIKKQESTSALSPHEAQTAKERARQLLCVHVDAILL